MQFAGKILKTIKSLQEQIRSNILQVKLEVNTQTNVIDTIKTKLDNQFGNLAFFDEYKKEFVELIENIKDTKRRLWHPEPVTPIKNSNLIVYWSQIHE